MLNPRQLEAFRSVMSTGSVTRAADVLHITQPAVSRLIRDLETTLRLKLFERTGGRVVPTGEAWALYKEVEASFAGLSRVMRFALNLRSHGKTIVIGALPTLATSYVPDLVDSLTREMPESRFSIRGLPSELVIEEISRGRCDIGLVGVPFDYGVNQVELLPRFAAVAIVPTGHPLARKPYLEPSDFQGQPFATMSGSILIGLSIERYFASHGVQPADRVETHLTSTACAMVATGNWLAIVDPHNARRLQPLGFVLKTLRPAIEIQFALVWPKAEQPLARVRAILDRIRSDFETNAETLTAPKPDSIGLPASSRR